MSTIEEVKAAAQATVDAVNALVIPVTVAPTITEVDVKESDGSEVVTTPAETPAVESAEVVG